MYTLLFVDDEPAIRMTFRNLLHWEDTPWQIAGMAANGEEALEILAQKPIDIVITDIKMPQMDGLTLIRRLNERHFSGAILILSNYSDFSLVRQAMQLGARDYMLKADMEADAIKEALTGISENLTPVSDHQKKSDDALTDDRRRSLLHDFLMGYPLPENIVYQTQIFLPHKPYRMLYLLPKTEDQTADAKSIKNVLLSNFGEQADVFSLDMHEQVCLVPDDGRADNTVFLRYCVQLVRQLKMYLNYKACVLVSASFSDTTEMKRQLALCRSKSRIFFYPANEGCMVAENITFSTLSEEPAIEKTALQLTDSLTLGIDKASEWADAFLEHCAKQNADPDLLKDYLFQVLRYVVIIHPQLAKDAESLEKISSCKSEEQLRKLLCSLFSSLIDAMNNRQTEAANDDVHKVLLYFQKHYAEHITLDTLSAVVNLDKSYLCRLFKKETGESLFQYLIRLRIEKASKLLLQEKLSVREISAKVGIDNPYYFARLFKKQYGVSPSEYAEKYKKIDGEQQA